MDNLALLHQKLDHLTELLEAQRRHQEELDNLKQELIPIGNHMIKLSIAELAEVGDDFELEDLLLLLKRLLRDTRRQTRRPGHELRLWRRLVAFRRVAPIQDARDNRQQFQHRRASHVPRRIADDIPIDDDFVRGTRRHVMYGIVQAHSGKPGEETIYAQGGRHDGR